MEPLTEKQIKYFNEYTTLGIKQPVPYRKKPYAHQIRLLAKDSLNGEISFETGKKNIEGILENELGRKI